MKIEISSQGDVATEKLKTMLQRQIDFALGRFEQRVRDIRVRLSDLNGPKGGIDKHCKITVTLRDGETVISEVKDTEFEPVIHRAVDRAARRMKRHLSLTQSRARAAAADRKNETGVGE